MKGPVVALVVVAGCSLASAQQPGPAPAGVIGPQIALKGKVARVQAAVGQRMPFLEVDAGGKTTKVWLGSMRFLIENNFNPKAGDSVEVEGFARGDEVVARTVTLTEQAKTLELRDENGRPLWPRGRRGWRHHPRYNEAEGLEP